MSSQSQWGPSLSSLKSRKNASEEVEDSLAAPRLGDVSEEVENSVGADTCHGKRGAGEEVKDSLATQKLKNACEEKVWGSGPKINSRKWVVSVL